MAAQISIKESPVFHEVRQFNSRNGRAVSRVTDYLRTKTHTEQNYT
jgi:hypothetical protein